MVFAESGFIFVLIVVGFLGFFLIVFALIAKIGFKILRALFGFDDPHRESYEPRLATSRRCINPGCACRNPSEARYCRRCGQPLP